MRLARLFFVAAGLLTLLPLSADAQRNRRAPRDPGRIWGEAGGAVLYGRPTGEFLDYVEQGFGFDGFIRYNFDSRGIFSLRGDLGYLSYGRETKRVPLSSTIGGRILVDLTTSNNIVHIGFGPQLTIPSGLIRPYVNASGHFAYFFTESSVEGSNNETPFANTTNFDDGAFGWSAGGGVLIPFGVRRDVALDIGLRYANNGRVQYLRKGSIIDLPGGNISINPIESEANLYTFRLGVSAALR